MKKILGAVALAALLLVAVAPTLSANDCGCLGTSYYCIIVNPDGSIGGYWIMRDSPKCAPV